MSDTSKRLAKKLQKCIQIKFQTVPRCGTVTSEYGKVGIETVDTKSVNQSGNGTGTVVLLFERKIEAQLHVLKLSFSGMRAFSHRWTLS